MWIRERVERPGASDRRRAAWLVVFSLVVPFQSVLAPIGAIGGVVPDLPFVIVVLFALGHRRITSAAAGGVVGALVDLFSSGSGSFHLAAYTLLAVLASSIGRLTTNVRALTAVTVVAFCSVAAGVGYAVTGAPVERADDMTRWMGEVLGPQVVYNTIVGWCLFAVWRWWNPLSRDAVGERDELFSSGRFQGFIR
ncbi:MAG TPA: rod shape-determining protein MreD [Nitrospiria bacterium]|nr:rod shape-determining protein MreD [Nitrospiria bacterium]